MGVRYTEESVKGVDRGVLERLADGPYNTADHLQELAKAELERRDREQSETRAAAVDRHRSPRRSRRRRRSPRARSRPVARSTNSSVGASGLDRVSDWVRENPGLSIAATVLGVVLLRGGGGPDNPTSASEADDDDDRGPIRVFLDDEGMAECPICGERFDKRGILGHVRFSGGDHDGVEVAVHDG